MTRKSLKFVATYIKVKTCISSQCRYLCGTSTSYAHGSTARPANAPKRKWLSLYILVGLRKSGTWRCFCIKSCSWWWLRLMLEKGRECLDYDAHAGSKLRFVLHTECRHRCKLQQMEEYRCRVRYWFKMLLTAHNRSNHHMETCTQRRDQGKRQTLATPFGGYSPFNLGSTHCFTVSSVNRGVACIKLTKYTTK